jgi:hypothetical protein
MLAAVEGVYENGRIHLLEPLPGVARARVVVTLLPEPVAPITPPTADTTELAGGIAPDGSETTVSALGHDLLAIRQRALEHGLALASVDTILEEVRQGRAEAGDDHDLR